MAIVLAETSRMVNVTAPQMAIRKSLMFPRNARNERPNSFSDSVRVGYGEFSNIVSIAREMCGTTAGDEAGIIYVPPESRVFDDLGSSSLRYSRWKMRHSVFRGWA